jgi:hypothetical protein
MPRTPIGGVQVQFYFYFNLGAIWGWVVNSAPWPLYPRERPSTHCIGGWVGIRASLDGCGKSHPPPGFDHRTVQPVASRYTDWAKPAHKRGEPKHWEKTPAPESLRAPQISHVPTRAWTPAAPVTAGDWPLEPWHGLCEARQTISSYFSVECSPISESARASPPCPSDNNRRKMTMSMEYYWNNTDRKYECNTVFETTAHI